MVRNKQFTGNMVYNYSYQCIYDCIIIYKVSKTNDARPGRCGVYYAWQHIF